jgi:hypothetical protein
MGTDFGRENVESHFFCMMMVVQALGREVCTECICVNFETSARVFVRVESCGRALLKTGILFLN